MSNVPVIVGVNQTGVRQAGDRVLLHAHRRHAEAVNDVLARELDDHRPVDRRCISLEQHDVVACRRVTADRGRADWSARSAPGSSRRTGRRRPDSARSRRTARRPRGRRQRPRSVGCADVRSNQSGSAKTDQQHGFGDDDADLGRERETAARALRIRACGCRPLRNRTST